VQTHKTPYDDTVPERQAAGPRFLPFNPLVASIPVKTPERQPGFGAVLRR
jgi:hypothetical protein